MFLSDPRRRKGQKYPKKRYSNQKNREYCQKQRINKSQTNITKQRIFVEIKDKSL
jgi:hypothetical protein